MTNLKAIAAVAENGVIGNGLQIPWRIPEDFKHFKATTVGGVIVMGRRTWESLGCRPLPLRENVVISSSGAVFEGAKKFASLGEVLAHYKNDQRTVWICGGAQLYKAALPYCAELILSRVKMNPQGDILFPKFDDIFEEREVLLREKLFDVIKYVNKKPIS